MHPEGRIFEMATNLNTQNTERAKQYKRAKIAMFVVGLVFSWISAAIFLFTGGSRKLTDKTANRINNRYASEGATVTLLLLLSWIISFPLAWLRGYRLEHQFDMSNQSFAGWLGDELKSLAIQMALMVPMSQVMLGVIRRWPRNWWAVLSAMAVPFTVVLAHLAPVLILPLFNTYQPIRDQKLAERLKALADRSGIHVAEIMEMDMSRQTKAANAFLTGIGSTKRIVLADTLIEQFTHDEIETIVAHEIAHQVNRDIWQMLALGVVTTTATTWLAQRIFSGVQTRTSATTGIRGAGYVEAIPLLTLITSVLGMVFMPAQNAYVRFIERKADRYALEMTGNPDAFKSSLGKLAEMNLADPDPPRLEQVLLHSHPSIADRQKACDEFAQLQDGD